jgi:arylsulfatase
MLRALVCLSALFVFSPALLAGPVKNVVILFADDWRHDTLGCAGHPFLKTPHLDQLAKEGTRFTHNCVTTSICGVSRATLLTGQWMSRHKNEAFSMFATPWEQTYPGVLRAAGFYTGHVGKWHNGKFDPGRYDFGRSYSGKHWMKEPDGSQIHVTQKNERDALDFLRTRPQEKPFCLTVAFFATHAEDDHPEQYLPQPESMKLYEDVTVPLPKTATEEHFKRLPDFLAIENIESRRRWHWRFDTAERYQRYMKNYLRLATEVDSTCGKIIAELKAQGRMDDTLIVFTTDNGYFHAEHGCADKWYPHEESIRVPLIVRDPRLVEGGRGKTNDALTVNADLAPTILSALGQTVPSGMQGRDMSGLYLGETKDWRRDYYYEHAMLKNNNMIPASAALVSREWKLMHWPAFGRWQLFHLTEDPMEERDLVGEASQSERLAEMKLRFAQLQAEAK